jgi:hypothetical protein
LGSFGVLIAAVNAGRPDQDALIEQQLAKLETAPIVTNTESVAAAQSAQPSLASPTPTVPAPSATPEASPALAPDATPDSAQSAVPTPTAVPPSPTAIPTATSTPAPPTPFPTPQYVDDKIVRFTEMYSAIGPRGAVFSNKLQALAGQQVEMQGYMAPPLKPALDFFVLTRIPLATCPFCSTDADWPVDIVFVRMPEDEAARPTASLLRVRGTLEIGSARDQATGFLSQVRLIANDVEAMD